jgi:hypothetical protein
MAQFAIPWLVKGRGLSRLQGFVLLAAVSLAFGCGKSGRTAGEPEAGPSATPAEQTSQTGSSSHRGPASTDIQAVAALLLGSSAEVLAFGNLAGNGQAQALVVNRAATSQPRAPEAAPVGTRIVPFTRASVIERNGTRWIEVLRCDEHLTNSKGFLAGAPLAPVTEWLVRWRQQHDGSVPALYFIPGQATGEVSTEPIAVRWNPKVNRYQSIDRTNNRFLSERALLETPTSILR